MSSAQEEITEEKQNILGQFVDEPESLTIEYKEFCIKTDIPEDMAQRIINGNINKKYFNKMIYENLKEYFNIYIPKYASAWSSTKIENGTLTIGISDEQEITGIPYFGNLNEIDVNELLSDSIQYLRGINDDNENICNEILEYYTSNIKISIKKLETIPEILEDTIDEFLVDYQKKIDDMNKKKKDIMKKRQAWWNLIAFYTRKLCYLSDSIRYRKEMGNYIRETDPTKIELINLCFNFEVDIIVPYNDTFWERKKDNNDIIYWITSYKDYAIQQLLKKKPKIPHIINYNPPYSYVLKQLTLLRKRFIQKNINYFLIEIEFAGNKNENEYLEFSYDKSYWLSKRRIGSSCENW